MKWDRVEYDDGGGYWLECKFPPLGELCIDNLSGKWQLFWFNGNGETVFSAHATEQEAKEAGALWVRQRIPQFSNALAEGCQQVDEE